MPFCTQCGTEVGPANLFCSACGTRQGTGAGPTAGTSAAASKPSESAGQSKGSGDFLRDFTPRKASLFCYIPIVGWIAAIVVLASERFREDREVRFHAFQGLYLFVVWLFVEWVFGPMANHADALRFTEDLLKMVVLGAWIFMLVKTHHGEVFHLPFIGELAERSVSEQK